MLARAFAICVNNNSYKPVARQLEPFGNNMCVCVRMFAEAPRAYIHIHTTRAHHNHPTSSPSRGRVARLAQFAHYKCMDKWHNDLCARRFSSDRRARTPGGSHARLADAKHSRTAPPFTRAQCNVNALGYCTSATFVYCCSVCVSGWGGGGLCELEHLGCARTRDASAQRDASDSV